jgi:hypothetical protein
VLLIFRRLRKGPVLSGDIGRMLRFSGGLLVLSAINAIVLPPAAMYIMLQTHAVDHGAISLGFGTNEFYSLVMACLFFALGHAMTVATEVEAENRSFV